MTRKMADLRRFTSSSGCTWTISGREDDVVRRAAEDAASVHGHADTAELRAQLRSQREGAREYVPGSRATEPVSG